MMLDTAIFTVVDNSLSGCWVISTEVNVYLSLSFITRRLREFWAIFVLWGRIGIHPKRIFSGKYLSQTEVASIAALICRSIIESSSWRSCTSTRLASARFALNIFAFSAKKYFKS